MVSPPKTIHDEYRGIEKQYLGSLISFSSWCDSRSRNQQFARVVYRLGHRPFTAGRGVRFPFRVPILLKQKKGALNEYIQPIDRTQNKWHSGDS